jgi:predicted kinase
VGVAGYAVAQALAADQLRLGLVVVADGVNPVRAARVAWAQVARGAGHRHLLVAVVCSDLAEHRRRVETRTADIARQALPTWDAVQSMHFESIGSADLVVDTAALSADAAAQRVIGALASA